MFMVNRRFDTPAYGNDGVTEAEAPRKVNWKKKSTDLIVIRHLYGVGGYEEITPKEEKALGNRIREAQKNLPQSLAELRKVIREREEKDLANEQSEDERALLELRQKLSEIMEAIKEPCERLVRANFPLLISIARRHDISRFEDAIHDGLLGLKEAAEVFDPEKGKFSTIAFSRISEAIQEAQMKTGNTIRLPDKNQIEILRMRRIMSYLSQMLGREPTIEETTNEWEANEKRREEAKAIQKREERKGGFAETRKIMKELMQQRNNELEVKAREILR